MIIGIADENMKKKLAYFSIMHLPLILGGLGVDSPSRWLIKLGNKIFTLILRTVKPERNGAEAAWTLLEVLEFPS